MIGSKIPELIAGFALLFSACMAQDYPATGNQQSLETLRLHRVWQNCHDMDFLLFVLQMQE